MSGKSGGSSFEGRNITTATVQLIDRLDRPYLHVYAHSNELEELSVVSLSGVKVEHNPEMEALFGVRQPTCGHTSNTDFLYAASVYIHSLHCVQLICTRCSQCQGASTMVV